jgi:hypothetical protein
MAVDVLFISENYLRDLTYIGGNVQDNVLKSAIKKAQTIKIQSVLGKALYEKLATDIYNAGGSISGLTQDYQTLFVDYVVPALTSWSLFESIVPLTLKFTNKGVSRAADSYTDGIDLETMKYIRDDARNEAEWATERLYNYLCNNSSLFPEYFDYTAQDLFPSAKAGRYSSGIFFKKPGVQNPFFPDKDDYNTYNY